MLYIAIAPVLIYSLFIIHKFNKLKKHDTVLYRFCQIRRNIMKLLRDNYLDLTVDSYKTLRNLLRNINLAIHDYNNLK